MEVSEFNQIEHNETQQVLLSLIADGERILVGCVYRPPGHIVSSAEEFFTSLKWVREKVESKVFDSVLICGDFNYSGINWKEYVGTRVNLKEADFIEKLEDSFMTQVIDFGTFSSGNVLDLVLVSETEIIL